jgi:hypothetical protein
MMTRNRAAPLAVCVCTAAALAWAALSPSQPGPLVGQSLTAEDLSVAVGQSGCAKNPYPNINNTCIVGATTCAPAWVCCFGVPVNQSAACAPETQNTQGGGAAIWAGKIGLPEDCRTHSVAPCGCGFTGCGPGTATNPLCGTKTKWFTGC